MPNDSAIQDLLEGALIHIGALPTSLLMGIPPAVSGERRVYDTRNDQLRADLAWVFENPVVDYTQVLALYLANALALLTDPAVKGAVLRHCAERGITLASQDVASPGALRHPLCDRQAQVAALQSRGSARPRRVLIHGGPAMGQRYLALRCVLESEPLLGAARACLIPLELGDLVDVASCWSRLAGALEVPFVEEHPEMEPINAIARIAVASTLALVHGPVRESDGGLEVLAAYHSRLAVRLEERKLTSRVLVMQAVEDDRSRGLLGWFSRLWPGPASAFARKAPFDQTSSTLVLPTLDPIPADQIHHFAKEILNYPPTEADRFVQDVSGADSPDLLYEAIRKRLREPREPTPRRPL